MKAHTYGPSSFGALLSMTTKVTYLMTAYYTPNDGFTANDALFYETSWLAILHVVLSFHLIVYTNIFKLLRYYRTLLRVTAKHKKKRA